MDSTTDSLTRTLRRARLGYEWARLRRAIGGFLPVFALIALACATSLRPGWSLGLGLGLFVSGVAVLWYGRELRRAVFPGIVAGVAPLVLVSAARHVGHSCDGLTCTSVCLAACLLGGLMAGLVVGTQRRARELGVGFWIVASWVAVLVGATACIRLGVAGVVGLLLGHGAGLAVGSVGRVLPRGRSENK